MRWIEGGYKALLIYGVRQAGKTFIVRECLKAAGCGVLLAVLFADLFKCHHGCTIPARGRKRLATIQHHVLCGTIPVRGRKLAIHSHARKKSIPSP